MEIEFNDSEIRSKRSRTRIFNVRAILAKSLIECVPLIEMLALDVDDKRKFVKLLKLLPPLPESCRHLKRINNGRILVGRTADELDNDLLTQLRAIISEDRFIRTKFEVPSVKPLTRAQFLRAKEYWPTAFHKDNALEKKLADNLFDEESVNIYADFFMKVESVKGALVYDPASNKIIVGPTSSNASRPLQHAIMQLLQSLAFLHSAEGAARRPQSGNAYLATGLDIVVYEEPCTMCAMALVHSRAKRVFFSRPNADHGALISRWRIQEEPNINHHYEVFQIDENL